MDKQKIFAVMYRSESNGPVEVSRQQIGVAILDESRVSARKYNELKRAAMKAYPTSKGNHHMGIVTEDGRKDKFGGYPAFAPYVRFEK